MSCREHPAERLIFDEQGRAVTLGLSEAELRLECVKVIVDSAVPGTLSATEVADCASTLADFVLGITPQAQKADAALARAPALSEATRTALRREAFEIDDQLLALKSRVEHGERLKARLADISRELGETTPA